MSSLSSITGSGLTSPTSSTTGSGGGGMTTTGTTTSNTTSNSGITGLNTSGISFTGLVSGLDTNSIIQGLLATDQQQVTNLTNQDNGLVQEQTAFQTLEAKLLNLQSDTSSLASTFNNVFDARTTTSSNQNAATAAASSGAAPGVYSFTVNSLAQAEELSSQGYASANSAITQGTLQLQVGSGATQTITVDNTNDTLQGLANSINNLGGDVTASIINDGSANTPYHLFLVSNNSGAANAINITNNLGASNSTATQLNLSNVVQPAADASITIGSGAGALTVASPTNTIESAFNGLTLNLVGTSSQPVSITVANDTTSAVTAIQNLVTSYNAVVDYINQNSTYNQQTGQAGIFLGNEDASSIQNDVTNALTAIVPGLSAQANNLTAIGITIDQSGDLQLNTNQLTSALNGQVAEVTPQDVASLFELGGQSTNPDVQFVTASDQTNTSGTPIAVNITQAATQASLSGDTALANSINIDGSDNALSVVINGQSATVTLAQGAYTPQSLAQEVQSELAGSTALAGQNVQVSVNGGNQLVLSSQAYGSNSQVTLSGGSALTALGFTNGGGTAHGQDVAGNYVVNGVTEPAQGNGQLLTGDSSNANTSGLEVRVTLGPSQVASSSQATLTVTNGIASQLNQVLNNLLDPVTGRLTTIDQSLQNSEQSIQQEITAQNAFIQARQQALVLQFANMEHTLAQLQEAGNILSGAFSTAKSSSTTSGSTSTPTSSTTV